MCDKRALCATASSEYKDIKRKNPLAIGWRRPCSDGKHEGRQQAGLL
jgi:hypothetical protein